MNALQSILAVSVLALSSAVSAQIVYVPDFPVKKSVQAETATEVQAPAADTTETQKAA
ncbi:MULTISPECIES: hypothetical protein [Acinetobacter]|uniref:hypothetical protein n=1 Tax=Acinetobacter TaxID=469 RepID=UPI0013EE6CA8|nr:MULTISPECIES: hypothetical protein [Acinetobacter]